MNEQEITGAVGSSVLHGMSPASSGQRRSGAGLWFSLERRGRIHLLACADVMRFYREEMGPAAATRRALAGFRGDQVGDAGQEREHGGGDNRDDAISSRDSSSGYRKRSFSRIMERATTEGCNAEVGASGGQGWGREDVRAGEDREVGRREKKRVKRVTDPWELLVSAVHAQVPLALGAGQRLRSADIPGNTGGR